MLNGLVAEEISEWPGNCVAHGWHGRSVCPDCSTSSIPAIRLMRETDRGFKAPANVHEAARHKDEQFYIVRLTAHEAKLMREGVHGKFRLISNPDHTWELVRYAD